MYSRKPFLKWAGGKQRLLDKIVAALPAGQRLVEPFVGSAALFLGTDYPAYLLADTNSDLINLYRHLAKDGKIFIKEAAALFRPSMNTAEKYYEFRQKFNDATDLTERALYFLYLNRHAYNGLCRYNSRGGFNVPFGKYVRPYFPKNELDYFVAKCKRVDVQFKCQSFQKTFKSIKDDDVIYCDPPYYPLSATSSFTTYTGQTFDHNEQAELARLAKNSPAPVIISNHDLHATRELYEHAEISSFPVRRCISCKGDGRKSVQALLALYS